MSFDFDDFAVLRLIEQYDTEAPAYRDYWAPVLHPIACGLIEELPEHAVQRALDIGAGAGLLLPVLQRKYNPSLVVGVDRSEGMLALADPDVPVAVMDAVSLGIQTEMFDLVVMVFLLFHLPDLGKGLVEARRVLRPGGILGTTTWAGDLVSPMVGIWNEELDAHGAVSGESLSRIACHEFVDTPEKTKGLFESAGYVSVHAAVHEFTHRIEPEEFILLRTRVGSTRERFESLDDNARRQCVTRVRARFSTLSADDFTVRMRSVLASAKTPIR